MQDTLAESAVHQDIQGKNAGEFCKKLDSFQLGYNYSDRKLLWEGFRVGSFLLAGISTYASRQVRKKSIYSASSLVLPLFGILTFIGISSCKRGCVWGTKFRFGVFVCLSLMFVET